MLLSATSKMLSAFSVLLAANSAFAQDPSPFTTATSNVVAALTDVGTFPTSFIGAIVGIESCSTSYALVCANGEDSRCYSGIGTETVRKIPSRSQSTVLTDSVQLTSIIGPSTQIANLIAVDDASTTSSWHVGCSFAGTTSAVCETSIMAGSNGESSAMSDYPTTDIWTEFVSLTVPITSGAQILQATQSGCSSSASTTGSTTGSTTDASSSSSSSSSSTETSTTTAQGLATSHYASHLDTGILLFVGVTAVLSLSLGIFL